jgi:hypothetical protein
MELLFIIGGICLFIWLVKRASTTSGPVTRTGQSGSPFQSSPTPKRQDVYRPHPGHTPRPTIVFRDQSATATSPPSSDALSGLHDAFTGAPLDVTLGLNQCTSCKVYYHTESVEVLVQENASQCVACGAASIIALTVSQARTTKGRDYDPDVITLSTYRSHFDRVVTFEGRVHSVRVSRRGTDYAVMLEAASWSRGLKLVCFRGAVRKVGGATFIRGLSGHTVRVRGLLVNHRVFGPQIIISERRMILEVQ